jgi:uncharacterized protein (DUF427 family)
MSVKPDPVGEGQESVWRYPRPAIAQKCASALRIVHRGVVVAETRACVRTLETSHPPTYYFPPSDVAASLLVLKPSPRRSLCEWKGQARYFDVEILGETLREVAWSYPDPSPDFAMLKDHVAFYARPFEACFVDGERATPQPGGFYGGWITSRVAGPFKGAPGSAGW